MGQRVTRVLLPLAIFAVVAYAWHLFTPWEKWGKVSFSWIDIAVGATIAFLSDSVRKGFDLEVNDEVISMKGSLFNRPKVRRGRIRNLHERRESILREPGLLLSEGGCIRRYFGGSVFHPQVCRNMNKSRQRQCAGKRLDKERNESLKSRLRNRRADGRAKMQPLGRH